MKCPRCASPVPAPPVVVAPYSRAIERLWACACGWWRLDFLGWADGEGRAVQLSLLLEVA